MRFFIPAFNDKKAFLYRAAWLLAALLLGGSRGNLLLAQAAANELVVISQVYGAGGNSGATYKNDFVELFNRGSSPVSLNGWTVQYAGAAGNFTTNNMVSLSGSLAPGRYYLVQLGSGGTSGIDLPAPDAIKSTINMAASVGKVALANNSEVVAGSTDTNVVDFVGYGSTASDAEGGSPTAAPSAINSISRNGDGCTDTDNNSADFAAVLVSPRNTSSTANSCGAQLTATPAALANFVTTTGKTSDEQSYVLTGTALSSAAVITAPTGYEVALVSGGPYQSSVTTGNPSSGSLSVTVYVVLDGSTTGTTTGSITNVSGSITTRVAVSGSSSAPVTTSHQVLWDGGAGTKFWFDAANWEGDAIPGTDAVVVLDHTFVTGSYQVLLQSRATTKATLEPGVEIESLTVNPGRGDSIFFEVPSWNISGNALSLKRTGATETALAIYDKGVVTNSAGPGGSAGAGITAANSNPTVYIYDGGTYRHYSDRSHKGVVDNLAAVAGTDRGIWEFRAITMASYSLSLSGRSYPTLVLRNRLGQAATSYTGSGAALTIRGDLKIGAGVSFSPNITGDFQLAGSLTMQGSLKFNPTAGRLVLNGRSPQLVVGTALGLPDNKDNSYLGVGATLQINNPRGIILLTPVTVNSTLQLTAGLLNTDNAVLTLAASANVSGGSPNSFVDGPLDYAAAGPATLRFPLGRIGTAGIAYRPLTLSLTALNAPTTFRAVQTEGAPTGNLSGNLARISRVRYFTVTPTSPAATFTGSVTLSFGSDDRVTSPEAGTLVVAGSNGPDWASLGHGSHTGNASGGTLTSGPLSSYNRFALASTDPSNAQNPLPVELMVFTARRGLTGALLRWTTASELNCQEFKVLRSFDGQTFTQLGRLPGHGTTSQPQTYQYADVTTGAAGAYYRLRQVDVDGRTTDSPTRFVPAVPGTVSAYPNPVADQLTIYTPAPAVIRLRSEVGQVVYQSTAPAGTSQHQVAHLPAGIYVLEIQLPEQPVIRQRLVKVR